ncbi:hypothetical protein AB4Y87_20135 [Paenarthrobacter sp. RAF54_2]|uniref:hypothetical protein n=1 Tax=Paenarthrobacter sp. RAF54_2 TaxID=3233061 RepID=UPI003F9D74AE
MGEWERGQADGQRSDAPSASVAVAILYIARGVTFLMIVGGLALAIWMYVWSREVIAKYPVEPDNDVTRGFFIGMAGGLGIAGLSVVALIGLSRGRRWGGIVDVFQWVVIWVALLIWASTVLSRCLGDLHDRIPGRCAGGYAGVRCCAAAASSRAGSA